MLLSLGLFVFQLQTVPYETLKRSTEYRWSATNRFGKSPAHQFLGPGTDTLTIDGKLMPELTGGPVHLTKLREMASSGKAWILTAGNGDVLGKWFIDRIEDTKSHMVSNGLARKIEFTISLTRYGNDDNEQLGNLMDSKP
ncbi:phage tail protein [Thalassospira sp.]|jgi:phage protein U|uniref:phage tail protein n=1 Tax=Thalassospira sp. TaxID=1912094 RepID=UPI001B0D34DF|nr:phage tail protein [Thalassospira sp.]MBO6805763.1 phage tail protein [Thalassospira sp.]MBO6841377.1 phage tail protein [Thalassospira sp.]